MYQSKVLPKLCLNTAWFWREPLPDVRETVKLVDAMLADSESES